MHRKPTILAMFIVSLFLHGPTTSLRAAETRPITLFGINMSQPRAEIIKKLEQRFSLCQEMARNAWQCNNYGVVFFWESQQKEDQYKIQVECRAIDLCHISGEDAQDIAADENSIGRFATDLDENRSRSCATGDLGDQICIYATDDKFTRISLSIGAMKRKPGSFQ